MSPQLLTLLSQLLLEGEGAIPIRVSLRSDDEIIALRSQVVALSESMEKLQRDFDRVEYRFRCESVLNNDLVDLCREHGIKIEPSFFKRPYSG